jgi:hypothetical protein
VHFSCKKLSSCRSNRPSPKQFQATRRRAASASAAPVRAVPLPRRLGLPAPSRGRPFPRSPHALRSLTRPEQRGSPRLRVSPPHSRRVGPTSSLPRAVLGTPRCRLDSSPLLCVEALADACCAPYKPKAPSPLRTLAPPPPCAPPTPLLAAMASSGLRSTARQNKRSLTFLCTPPSSSACLSYPQSPTAPVQQAAVATVAGRRRRPSPTSSPPRASTGIGPQGPKDPPPPVPSRPRPAVGQNLAGPPLAGRQGPHCKEVVLLEGLTAKLQLK